MRVEAKGNIAIATITRVFEDWSALSILDTMP